MTAMFPFCCEPSWGTGDVQSRKGGPVDQGFDSNLFIFLNLQLALLGFFRAAFFFGFALL